MDINFSGPLNQTGYGQVSTNLFLELSKNNKVALWPLPTLQHVQVHLDHHKAIKEGVDLQSTYDNNAPSIRHWHQFDLAQHIGKGPRIGSTVFELNKFTDREIHHLMSQDAICVPTEWAKEILHDHKINLPVCVLPHGVDRSIFNENVKPSMPELSKNNTTVFINVGKNEIRKGHDILVEAFNKAFEQKDNVHLIMAGYNPFYSKEENYAWEQMYETSRLGNKITVLKDRLETQHDVASLMASADCGVFPARAEGWNLEALELMSMGKSVILTNYAGHTGFANWGNSLLIDGNKLEDAYDGKWFYGQGQWLSITEDMVDQIVDSMRLVHAHKQKNCLGINKAGIETAKRLSWENAAGILTNFISSL